tara:strand:+ start:323 stop:1381 length:1059 start_codon:yes stop_codon:yes gene_type:complete
MAQADGVVANGTGSAVRSDINNQYAALWSNHSGSTEPSSGKVAYQTWADTNSGYLKIRNAANNAWVSLFKLDGTDLANICRLTGSTNNRITTVTGENTIQGEVNLTFDGSVLRVKNSTNGEDGVVYIEGGEGANAAIEMVADEADDDADKWLMKSTNGGGWHLQNKASGSYENNIVCATNSSVDLYYDNVSKFETNATGAYCKGALRIGADNAANELDTYEEGEFAWRLGGNNNKASYYMSGNAEYTKIGRFVFVHGYIAGDTLNASADGQIIIHNLPFAPQFRSYGGDALCNVHYKNVTFDASKTQGWLIGSTGIVGYQSTSGGTHSDWDCDDFKTASTFVWFGATYITAT